MITSFICFKKAPIISDIKMNDDLGFGTHCVHDGEGHNPFGAHATPIYQTSTYVMEITEQSSETLSKRSGYRYIRAPPNSPTHSAFVDKMCSLEEGEAGIAFSSGMAAEMAIILSQLKSGDHLLSSDVIYGGTYALFSSVLPRFGIEVDFADTIKPDNVEVKLKPNTKMIYLETPANPTMGICDIVQLSEMAHNAGALCVVDNTFATPYFQKRYI